MSLKYLVRAHLNEQDNSVLAFGFRRVCVSRWRSS